MIFHKMTTTVFLTLLLSACQSMLVPASTPTAKPETRNDAESAVNSDLLYNYLVGEIGAHTGELQTALRHYVKVIQAVEEPYAAERATRIALHLNDYSTGLQAADIWLQLAPKSLPAHQFAAILHLRTGQLGQAQAQFEALLDLIGDANKSGLLLIAGALKEEPDKAAVLKLIRNMLVNRPHDAHAHYAVGVVEAAQNRHIASELSLRRAIELKADWSLPHMLLAQVLLAQGKKAQALQHLQDSMQQYPEQNALRHAYARHLIDAERFADALTEFRKLHTKDPQNTEISYALAILATQQEIWDEARRLWQDLRSKTKFYADATYFLGQVEEATANTVLAIGLYNSVPDGERRVDAIIRASRLLAKTERLEKALEPLKQLRKHYPKDSANIYLAEAELLIEQTQDTDSISALYAEALRNHPQHNDLQYSRGLYFANQGRYKEMEADFLAVLERDAQHAETLNALGYTWADQNIHLDKALGYIQRALQQHPNNAAVLDSMGWVHYRLGNLDKAEDYLRQAFDQTQDDEIAAHLGEVLWMQGRQDEAQKVWRNALEEKPDSKLIKKVLERLGISL